MPSHDAACTCGQRHTTWTNDKDVSNEGHSVACPANPQFAKPSAATGQAAATRVGICLNDYEMFWWRADDGESCPVCSTEDEDYEASHRFYVSEGVK